MINATDILSKFCKKLNFEMLDEATVEQTRLFIADYYAACYAGYRVNKFFNESLLEIVREEAKEGESIALFSEESFSPGWAGYINAVYAHGADIDDGNRKARGHIASHVMSAVFAVADTMNATWKELFVAINAGYEVYNRIAAAVQPELLHRGFHSTGTAGAIACGAACAKLMRLDANGIYQAMSISALQASGLIIIAESGQACKPLNPANAAKTGIISAKLAARGVIAPSNPLESEKGWFHAMGDSVREEYITSGLGKLFTINECYIKPYPSCRHTHCCIEAASEIKRQMDAKALQTENIKSIDIRIYGDAIKVAGQIEVPQTAEEAKFSIHYATAAAIQKGGFSFDELRVPIDENTLDLIKKIKLTEDDGLEEAKSGIRGAELCLKSVDGQEMAVKLLLPKGEGDKAFTWMDMETKLLMCMQGLGDTSKAKALLEKIKTIKPEEKYSNLGIIIQ